MASNLKSRMHNGEQLLGFWLELFSPMAAEVMAEAGYNCAMLDMEHGPGGFLDCISVMQAMKGTDCVPLVRVPWNDHVAIKRSLDAGARGIMVPSVDSAEQARQAVAACRYAPGGRRGNAASIIRASGYGVNAAEYLNTIQDELLVICQIETHTAVESAAAIADVEGVDMLFVGPSDLSTEMGLIGQVDHPQVHEAIAKVEAAAKSAGKLIGHIPTPKRPVKLLVESGASLILTDADVALLRNGARSSIEAFRSLTGTK